MIQRSAWKIIGGVSLLAFTLVLTGCGGKGSGPQTSVSGKVTQGGQPVAGSVTFIDSANKEYSSPISPEGKYQILNPPTGQMKIVVKGGPSSTGTTPPGGVKTPDLPGNAAGGGVAPNAKYAKPDNGLTYEVKAGEQTYDIDLK